MGFRLAVLLTLCCGLASSGQPASAGEQQMITINMLVEHDPWTVTCLDDQNIRIQGGHGQGTPTGRTVRPHLRRAHWHLYWTGEGSRHDPARAIPVLRWLPPIPVKLDEAPEPIVRPVPSVASDGQG